MARKGGYGFLEPIKIGFGLLSEIVIAPLSERMHAEVDVILNKVEKRVVDIEKRVMARVYFATLIGIAVIFLLLAAFFYLVDFIHVPRSAAFLAAALVALLMAFFIHYKQLAGGKHG